MHGDRQNIFIAGWEHADGMRQIYRTSRIGPETYEALCGSEDERSAAREHIRKNGGFIKPHSEDELRLAIDHGITPVFVENGQVLAYNKCATDAGHVLRLLSSEFGIGLNGQPVAHDQFKNWRGKRGHGEDVVQTRIHWIDRDQAAMAFNAALAGLEGKPSGRLNWALEAASHPAQRNRGLTGRLFKYQNRVLDPELDFRAWRMFELRRVNSTDLVMSNEASTGTFVRPDSKIFAYTEEEIRVYPGIRLLVRWNHWLRHLEA